MLMPQVVPADALLVTAHCAVEQLIAPLVHRFPVLQVVPHETQKPLPLQVDTPVQPVTCPAPRFALSTQAHVVPLRAYWPVLQIVGLVVQAVPSAHIVQPPTPSQKPPVHAPPAASGVAVSSHVCAPVMHDVIPAKHECVLVEQGCPAVHATQAPAAEHTSLVPQPVPAARRPVPSSHEDVPVPQLVTPFLHGVGLPVHATPGAQAPHTPAPVQTPPSQPVPAVTLPRPSVQRGAPEVQSMTPALHVVGLPVHAPPTLHAAQPPSATQNIPVPHFVPGDSSVAVSAQVDAPVAHEVAPTRHPTGFVQHRITAAHVTHAPVLLHT